MKPSELLLQIAESMASDSKYSNRYNVPDDAAYSYMTYWLHQSADYSMWTKIKNFILSVDAKEPNFETKEHAIIALCFAAELAREEGK